MKREGTKLIKIFDPEKGERIVSTCEARIDGRTRLVIATENGVYIYPEERYAAMPENTKRLISESKKLDKVIKKYIKNMEVK